MSRQARRLYGFGPFRIDPAERTLLRNERPVQLTPKVFDTLLALVENSGHVLGKNELMRMVWPDSFVEENNLAQNISVLRKVLGEGAEGLKYIDTVPKRGYRFTAPVEELWDEPEPDLIIRERTRARVVIEEEDETGQDLRPFGKTSPAVIDALALPDAAREQARVSPGLVIPHAPETKYARSGDVSKSFSRACATPRSTTVCWRPFSSHVSSMRRRRRAQASRRSARGETFWSAIKRTSVKNSNSSKDARSR